MHGMNAFWCQTMMNSRANALIGHLVGADNADNNVGGFGGVTPPRNLC